VLHWKNKKLKVRLKEMNSGTTMAAELKTETLRIV